MHLRQTKVGIDSNVKVICQGVLWTVHLNCMRCQNHSAPIQAACLFICSKYKEMYGNIEES